MCIYVINHFLLLNIDKTIFLFYPKHYLVCFHKSCICLELVYDGCFAQWFEDVSHGKTKPSLVYYVGDVGTGKTTCVNDVIEKHNYRCKTWKGVHEKQNLFNLAPSYLHSYT